MAEKQLQDFYRRAGRYERAFARGHGFEAPGTLGRSSLRRRGGVQVPVLGPLAVLFGVCLMMKVAITLHLGPDLYTERLARLQTGTMVEQIGAYVMAPDPISGRLAQELGRLF